MKATDLKDIYIGLGSNMGNKKAHLRLATEKLSQVVGEPIAISSIMETEPWGFDSKEKFLNCVLLFRSNISPEEILDKAEEIERLMGRNIKSDKGEYHDRPIDIDILFYSNEVIDTPRLKIPHPLLHKRIFVLQPLNEIAPTLLHPTLKKSISRLLDEL